MAGHGFEHASDNNNDNNLLGNNLFSSKITDSATFPFETDFKVGTYDLSKGYDDTWAATLKLNSTSIVDTKPDSITFDMGLYIGVYNNSGDIIVVPVEKIGNLVSLDFIKESGADTYHYVPKQNNPNTSSSTSTSSSSMTTTPSGQTIYEEPNDPSDPSIQR